MKPRRPSRNPSAPPREIPSWRKDLHEARSALRRAAALLRFFDDGGGAASRGARLRGSLLALSKALGPARDATVWVLLLESKRVRRAMAGAEGWSRFVAGERARERAAYARLGRPGADAAVRGVVGELDDFLRRGLPGLPTDGSAGRVAMGSLRRRAKRLLALDVGGLLSDPQELHDLRRKMRRLRYLADTFAPALPHKVRRLAKKLRRIEARLGELHDLDVALARLKCDRRKPVAKLAHTFARRRQKLASKC